MYKLMSHLEEFGTTANFLTIGDTSSVEFRFEIQGEIWFWKWVVSITNMEQILRIDDSNFSNEGMFNRK